MALTQREQNEGRIRLLCLERGIAIIEDAGRYQLFGRGVFIITTDLSTIRPCDLTAGRRSKAA